MKTFDISTKKELKHGMYKINIYHENMLYELTTQHLLTNEDIEEIIDEIYSNNPYFVFEEIINKLINDYEFYIVQDKIVNVNIDCCGSIYKVTVDDKYDELKTKNKKL